MTKTAVLGETPFAVIDVEATGIYPGGHDRIIEVAVVRMSPRFEIEDQWVTLVNPQRDVGRTDLHGIRAADLAGAGGFGFGSRAGAGFPAILQHRAQRR